MGVARRLTGKFADQRKLASARSMRTFPSPHPSAGQSAIGTGAPLHHRRGASQAADCYAFDALAEQAGEVMGVSDESGHETLP